MAQESRAVELIIDGKKRVFDIDDPKLPDWVDDNDITAGGYPYKDRMGKDDYEDQLEALQIQAVNMHTHMQNTGKRVIAVFEGRDAAGKGGSISVLHEFLNPRTARNVALSKPSDVERGQWYFQWDDYTAARDTTISATHSAYAPWTVIRMNDKRRGRLEVLRHILSNIDYEGKDRDAIGSPDPKIIGSGPEALDRD